MGAQTAQEGGRPPGSLVGREQELAELRAALGESSALGRLISGEPGIGKIHLPDELAGTRGSNGVGAMLGGRRGARLLAVDSSDSRLFDLFGSGTTSLGARFGTRAGDGARGRPPKSSQNFVPSCRPGRLPGRLMQKKRGFAYSIPSQSCSKTSRSSSRCWWSSTACTTPTLPRWRCGNSLSAQFEREYSDRWHLPRCRDALLGDGQTESATHPSIMRGYGTPV